MKPQEITVQTLLDDLRISFRLAARNVLSYVLGALGMGLVTALVITAIMIPIGLGVMVLLGPLGVTEAMTNWGAWMASLPPGAFSTPTVLLGMGGAGALFLLLVAAVAFAFIGPLYGMSKEIVEGGETRAEAAFTWLRQKFWRFAAAGVLIFLVVVGPAALVGVGVGALYGWAPPALSSAVVSAAAFIWFFLAYGLVATTLPGVADGLAPLAALRQSIRHATVHFDRVYGVVTGFLLLFVALYGPVAVWGVMVGMPMTMPVLDPVTLAVAIWTVIGSLVAVFIGIPAHFLALTRVYLILQGKAVEDLTAPETPDVALIGGN